MKTFLFSALLLTLCFSALAGGPWTNKKGKYYIKGSEFIMNYKNAYSNNGLLSEFARNSIFNTYIYGEYGLNGRIDLLANLNVLSLNSTDGNYNIPNVDVVPNPTTLNTFGDMDFGIKYSLTKPGKSIPVAASLILGMPTGQAGTTYQLQSGDGEFNQMLRVETGMGFKLFNKLSGYGIVYGAFNNRTNNYSEEIRYGGEIGFSFLKNKIWLTGKLNGIKSLNNGSAPTSSGGLFSNNQEYLSYAFELNTYITKKVGISLNTASAFFARNIAGAPSYSVGVFYDMTK